MMCKVAKGRKLVTRSLIREVVPEKDHPRKYLSSSSNDRSRNLSRFDRLLNLGLRNGFRGRVLQRSDWFGLIYLGGIFVNLGRSCNLRLGFGLE
jgi:hypothetical protein